MSDASLESAPQAQDRPIPRASGWLEQPLDRLQWLVPRGHAPLSRADLCWAVALALVFATYAFATLWGEWLKDFAAYYYAGHFFGIGEHAQVYAGPPDVIGAEIPPAWAEALADDGAAGEQTYPFIYPPWVAAVMAPVAATVSPHAAMKLMLVLNTGLLMLCTVLAWRIVPTRFPLRRWLQFSALLLIVSAPSLFALVLGQIQILVFTACLLFVDRLKAGRQTSAALWLALATVIKVSPAAFAIILVWNRNWKALAIFATASLGFLAFGIAALGWPLHEQYFGLMEKLSSKVIISNIGISAEGLLFQLTELLSQANHAYAGSEVAFPKEPWQDLTVKALFIAGLLATWSATRRASAEDRVAWQFVSLSVLVPLMTPLGWVHYYLLFGFTVPFLIDRGGRPGLLMFALYFLLFNLISLSFVVRPVTAVMPVYFLYVPCLGLLWAFVTFRQNLFRTSATNG